MRSRHWAVIALSAVTGIVGGAAPAQSECLVMTAEVHWWDDVPDSYPLGQRDSCMAETPWNQGSPIGMGWDFKDGNQRLPGAPQGFYVGVVLTGP